MFEEQDKVKVDNNHDGVILRQHPDKTSCLVAYNGQTGWVQNGRLSKQPVVNGGIVHGNPASAAPAAPDEEQSPETESADV